MENSRDKFETPDRWCLINGPSYQAISAVLQYRNHNQNLECIDVIFVVQCHSLYVIYMNSEFLACMFNIVNKQKKKKRRNNPPTPNPPPKKKQKKNTTPPPKKKPNYISLVQIMTWRLDYWCLYVSLGLNKFTFNLPLIVFFQPRQAYTVSRRSSHDHISSSSTTVGLMRPFRGGGM